MPERIDVFISSTSRDLKKYRDKLKDAILNAGAFPLGMEEFDASEQNALQKCYDAVASAEIFVGVYAHRYGFAPGADMTYTDTAGAIGAGDSATSITRWEYQWARDRGIPMLLYVVGDSDDEGEPLAWTPAYIDTEPARSHLDAFKVEIMGRHVVGFFTSPDDLARQVAGALPKLIARFTDGDAEIPVTGGRHDFYRHVSLPANFVRRPDLVDLLRSTLLARADGLALHGMGGIGKSVMARALCDDQGVQAAFPDGILWVSIGQDAREDDLQAKLRAWIETLGGAVADAAPAIERLKEMLAALLARRRCLLIIDDVWRRRDAEHFRVGGDGCRLLVTTRDAEVARSLGVPVQTIPLMSDGEADALLDQWAEGALGSATESARRRIYADTLGRLPLAIRLAGAQLRGRSPDEWLGAFDARRLALRRPESIHDSLALTFGLSLDALTADDRALYAALAIFREDESIPESAIRRLWHARGGLDMAGTADLIDDLAARALVEIDRAGESRAVVLHDLLRDFVRAELGDAIPVHRALLDAYRAEARGASWDTVPDDGYLYAHLADHLVTVGDVDGLWALFAHDGWMRARVAADGYRYDGFIADLELARRHSVEPRALAQIERGDPSFAAFADVARCTLIRTTINSLASMHVRELVIRAVEIGLPGWSAARALSTARHMLRPTTRVKLYTGVIATGVLTPAERAAAQEAAIADARSISEFALRIEAIASIVPIVDGAVQTTLIAEALSALEAIAPTESLVYATSEIARHVDDATRALLTRRALDAIFRLTQENPRADALYMLAPLLAADQQPKVLDAIAAMDNERFAVDVLDVLLPVLHDSWLEQAMRTVESFRFAGFRARARVALALRLPGNSLERLRLIGEAQLDVETPMDWWIGASALAAVARVLDGEARDAVIARVFQAVNAIDGQRSRLRVLSALAVSLQPSDRLAVDSCLIYANQGGEDEEIAALLKALAGKLDSTQMRTLLNIASRLEDIRWRAGALAAHARYLDHALLTEALMLNARIGDQRDQIEAVVGLGSALQSDDYGAALSRALGLVEAIGDPKQRAKALVPLASALRGAHFETIRAAIDGFADEHSRMKVAAAAARHLTDSDQIESLLHIVLTLGDADLRSEALLDLWTHLDAATRQQLAADIGKSAAQRPLRSHLRLLQAAESEGDRRDELIGMAMEQARQITSPSKQAAAIGEIARIRIDDALMDMASNVLEAALGIRYQWTQASALSWLSRLLTPAQRARVIAHVRDYSDTWARLWIYAALLRASDSPQAALLAETRRDLFHYMRGRTLQKRAAVLQFLSSRAFYNEPLFNREDVIALVRTVIAICWEWEWL